MTINKQPQIGVGVIVCKDNKILLGKRKNSHGAGLWSFPGGHLEFNEDIEGCAMREVFEETGLIVSSPQKITFINDIFPKDDKHYVTLYLAADWVAGEAELKEPDKCEGWEWFSWGALPKPLWSGITELLSQGYLTGLMLRENQND
jgi:8-oxo-dGTP diphosphatase